MIKRKERYGSEGRTRAPRALAVRVLPAVLLLTAAAGSGQEGGEVTVDVTECVKLTSPADRLACFEAGVDNVLRERSSAPEPAAAAPPASAPPAAVVAPQPAARPPAAAPAPAAPAAAREAAPSRPAVARTETLRAPDPAPAEIIGEIAALRETVPNSYVITLADGQVWRQTRAERYPLSKGATVRIYRVERWGTVSHRLTAVGRGGFIQVAPVP